MNIPHQLQAIDCMASSICQRRLIELLASQSRFYRLGLVDAPVMAMLADEQAPSALSVMTAAQPTTA